MKERNRKILVVLFCISFILAMKLSVDSLIESYNTLAAFDYNNILFHDNISFASYQTYKVENFTLDQEETVKFEFAIDVGVGKVLVRVYDDNDNEIVKVEKLNYEEEFTRVLPEGNYTYELELLGVRNGSVKAKAFIE